MVCAFAYAAAEDAATFIVKDGKPKAEIVIAQERPRMVSLAALELQYYLEMISGARLPIVTRPGEAAPVKIHVGESELTARLVGVTDEVLKYGAFRMVSGADYLVLFGHDFNYVPPEPWPRHRPDMDRAQAEWDKVIAEPAETKWGYPFRTLFKGFWSPRNYDELFAERYGADNKAFWNPQNLKWSRGHGPGFWVSDEGGSLNAVYEFLRTLGARWYMPGELGEVIPEKKTIPLPQLDKTVRPDFAVRSYFWYNYAGFPFEHVIWARRSGMNSWYEVLGNIGYAHGLVFVHGRKEMKDARPDYYALIGGQRDTEHRGYGTACYSSEGLAKEAVKFGRFVFDHYNQPHISLWPTDGFKMCGCKLCKGKSASELVWGFVDRVARELYKTHPDRLVSCGAYTPYVDPPVSIRKFSPNVAVFISNTGRPLLNDPERWKFYWARVEAWQKVLAPGRIMRVENNRYGLSRTFPVIHTRAMAKDLRALKGISVGECCEEAQHRMRWHSPGFDHLTLYVQSRFLWDADQDVEALLREYYTLFYGPARQQMRAAFDFAEAVYNGAAKAVGGRHARSPGNVGLPGRIKFMEMLHAALKVAGDTVYGERIQVTLDELGPLDELREQLKKEIEAGDPREKAPVAVGRDASRPGDPKTYELTEIETGKQPDIKTTFSVTWDKGILVFDIRCQDPDMKNLFVTEDVWGGDSVAILLETPSHAYYQIEVNPDGKLFDADRKIGLRTRWKSQAEVKTERGKDHWRVTVRVPIVEPVQGSMDPNHNVVGPKPSAEAPWHFNVGRARVRGQSKTAYTFSPTGTRTYHVPDKFGKLEIR